MDIDILPALQDFRNGSGPVKYAGPELSLCGNHNIAAIPRGKIKETSVILLFL